MCAAGMRLEPTVLGDLPSWPDDGPLPPVAWWLVGTPPACQGASAQPLSE